MTGSWRSNIIAILRGAVRVGAFLAAATDQPKWMSVGGLIVGETASLIITFMMREERVSDEQAGAGVLPQGRKA